MNITKHVHRTWDGEYDRDEWGRLSYCFDGACIEWASSNQRLVDTIGAAILGGLFGALAGSLARRPVAGAVVGAALGALAAQGTTDKTLDGPIHDGVLVLPPRPSPLPV